MRRDADHRPVVGQVLHQRLLIAARGLHQHPFDLLRGQPTTQRLVPGRIVAHFKLLLTRIQGHRQTGLGDIDPNEYRHCVLP